MKEFHQMPEIRLYENPESGKNSNRKPNQETKQLKYAPVNSWNA